jgi:hypothetical protein
MLLFFSSTLLMGDRADVTGSNKTSKRTGCQVILTNYFTSDGDAFEVNIPGHGNKPL